MCGIAGFVGEGNRDDLVRMTTRVSHRGPDGEGFWTADQVFFGHRRLSIVDLAGAQRSDLKMFTEFFHTCVKRGVYFAPSQFETGFISTAHTPEDIERTGAVVRKALAEFC